MSNLIIYINDDLIDLYPDTKIQVTIPTFRFGDLKTRQTNFTNSIKCPNTENNQSVFGIINLASKSTKPYRNFTIKILESGIEIFLGKCYVSLFNNEYTLSGIGEEADILDQFRNTYVSDVETADSGVLDDSTYYTYRSGLNDIYCPVMNGGKFTNLPPNRVPNGSFVSASENFGWEEIDIFYATAPSAVTFRSINYSVSGEISVTNPSGNDDPPKQLLNSGIKFYQGYNYKVTVNSNQSTSEPYLINIYAKNSSTKNYESLGGTESTASSGNHTSEFTFFTSSAYEEGLILRFELDAVPGSSTTFKVYDVSISVDYQSDIIIEDPFYIPSFGYLAAINNSIEQTFTGTVNYNLSASQQAELDAWVINSIRDSAEYSSRFINKRTVKAEADGTQVINFTTTAKANINFPTIVQTEFGSWPNTYTYTVPNIAYQYYADVRFDIVLNVTALSGGAIGSIDIVVGGTTYTTIDQFNSTGRKYLTINTADTEPVGNLMDNNTVVCSVINTTVLGNITANIESAFLTITPIKYPQDEDVQLSSYILPDVTTYDILKDYVVRTVSLFKYNSVTNELNFKPIQNIINDKSNAVDWTLKRVSRNDPVSFYFQDYAQSNFFEDRDYLTNAVARGELTLSNEWINLEKTYYTSFFDTVKDQPVKQMDIVNTNVFGFDSEKIYQASYSATEGVKREYDFNLDEKTVLLKVRGELATDPVIKYGSATAATYTVANYVKWSDIMTMFYSGLQDAITQTKVIDRLYNLTPVDVYNFDTFRLVFDTDSYFIVLELKYQPGELSKVKLLKVF